MTGVVSKLVTRHFNPKPIFVFVQYRWKYTVKKMYKMVKTMRHGIKGMYFDDNGNIVTNGYIYSIILIKENFLS